MDITDHYFQLEEVTFAYDSKRPLLTRANFHLLPGERVGLVGPNGSGKTTLLHLLVGLLKPQSGTILAFDSIRKQEKDFYEVRARAGLVFQDSDDQLFCPTVLEDVAFGPLNLGKTPEEARRIAIDTLYSLELDGFEDRITYQLSYGEKRMVALATVLAMRPDVLLLDEPTNGLDEDTKKHLTTLLCSLPQSMVIISHEADFIEHLATRIVRIEPDGALE
jgi:cobalt/nickel transport system ATP-binding protein